MTDARQRLEEAYADYQKLAVLQPLAAEFPFVDGDGPLNTPLVIVGEAPGEQESRQGRPFTGPAGKRLDEWLKEAGIPRAMARVTNVLHYQMPGNRSPWRFEIVASQPCLLAELDIVRPVLVMTFGAAALSAVYGGGDRLSAIHGQMRDWRHPAGWDTKLLPLFHPSYALRNREADRLVRESLRQLGEQ
jgi:DNA polymerase